MSRKRGPDTGGSPAQKKLDFIADDEEWPDNVFSGSSAGDSLPSSGQAEPSFSPGILSEPSISSQVLSELGLSQPTLPLFFSQPSLSSAEAPPEPVVSNLDYSFSSDSDDSLPLAFQTDFLDEQEISQNPSTNPFMTALETFKEDLGIETTAKVIMANTDLKEEITKLILDETHQELKKSLKHSILTANKKDRRYLLSMSPKVLCEELKEFAPLAHQVLVNGLLGVADQDSVLGNKHLTNNLAMLFSTIAKTVNRKASGYGLLLTAVARDGGLREDSIKLFCNLSHPRTAQKYDREVLANGWDTKLHEALAIESLRFQELKAAELDLLELDQLSGATASQKDASVESIELLRSTMPPQIQLVWDNLNLRTKKRFERQRDTWADSNLDWMASIWIQERISGNHMKHHPGEGLKEPGSLSIQDFVPSSQEEDYLFTSLVYYYAHRLTQRHPLLFKSLKTSMKASLGYFKIFIL